MVLKSISASSVMPESSYFSTFNSTDPQLYFIFKCNDVLDTSKNVLSFPCVFCWLKCTKISPKNRQLAIYLLSFNRSAKVWFRSLIKHRCHCVGTLSSIFLIESMDVQMKQTSTVLCPISPHKHQINECARDGIWCDWQQMKYIFKLMSGRLKFLSLPNLFQVKTTTRTPMKWHQKVF